MIEQLIIKMFASRNAAHLQHWKTDSYAKHKALGKFYEELVEILDKYVEAHQGTFGLIGEMPEDQDTAKLIHDDIIWLNKNRSQIAKNIPALENILDELTGLHMATLYKLENLR